MDLSPIYTLRPKILFPVPISTSKPLVVVSLPLHWVTDNPLDMTIPNPDPPSGRTFRPTRLQIVSFESSSGLPFGSKFFSLCQSVQSITSLQSTFLTFFGTGPALVKVSERSPVCLTSSRLTYPLFHDDRQRITKFFANSFVPLDTHTPSTPLTSPIMSQFHSEKFLILYELVRMSRKLTKNSSIESRQLRTDVVIYFWFMGFSFTTTTFLFRRR